MPKYYCDYCDIFLTHDSPSVRRSHNLGWKHKAAVEAYYRQFEQSPQDLIEMKIRLYESGGAAMMYPGYPYMPPAVPMVPPPVPPPQPPPMQPPVKPE